METQLLQQLKQEYQDLLDQHNLAEAMPLIRQAANWGDLEAQILAKNIFLHGLYHHPITHHAALEYAQVAAMNGDASSMFDLAWLYQNGKGILHDDQKALYWLDKAANQNEPRAMDAYGMLYMQGRIIQKDPYQNGKGILHDDQKALYWLDKAANQNEPRAMDAYGMLYMQGRIIQKDPQQAKYWFEKAYALDPNDQYAKHVKMANLLIEKQNHQN